MTRVGFLILQMALFVYQSCYFMCIDFVDFSFVYAIFYVNRRTFF